jgi:aerobic-type carbon monoxide dehydrogenase small subunit (CoxS/CutS family)
MGTVTVNGKACETGGTGGKLIGFLRYRLGLTGLKPGCGEGECGACAVLVDGELVLSCQVELDEVAGHSVTTIEGLAADGFLHPVQQALVEERASQCGYCLPGIALRLAALMSRKRDLGDHDVAAALAPQLCRCGCYARVLKATKRAAELMAGGDRLRDEPGARRTTAGTGSPAPALGPLGARRQGVVRVTGGRSRRGVAPAVSGRVGHERRCVVAPGPFRSGDGLQWQGRRGPGQPDGLPLTRCRRARRTGRPRAHRGGGTLMSARTIWGLSGAARCLIRGKRFGGPPPGLASCWPTSRPGARSGQVARRARVAGPKLGKETERATGGSCMACAG